MSAIFLKDNFFNNVQYCLQIVAAAAQLARAVKSTASAVAAVVPPFSASSAQENIDSNTPGLKNGSIRIRSVCFCLYLVIFHIYVHYLIILSCMWSGIHDPHFRLWPDSNFSKWNKAEDYAEYTGV